MSGPFLLWLADANGFISAMPGTPGQEPQIASRQEHYPVVAKFTRRQLSANDPLFTNAPRVFTPIGRPRPSELILDQLVGASIQRGSIEASLASQLDSKKKPT